MLTCILNWEQLQGAPARSATTRTLYCGRVAMFIVGNADVRSLKKCESVIWNTSPILPPRIRNDQL